MSLSDRYLDWKKTLKYCLTLFIHKKYVAYSEICHFLCSVISQGKVVVLDRWGGKWNHLSMTPRLTTEYAKNYCNRTLTDIVKVIVENVVTCFFMGQCTYSHRVCQLLHLRTAQVIMYRSYLVCLSVQYNYSLYTHRNNHNVIPCEALYMLQFLLCGTTWTNNTMITGHNPNVLFMR